MFRQFKCRIMHGMTNKNRYKASGAEGEFEPGSNGLVLRNLLQITDPAVMDKFETDALGDLTQKILGEITNKQKFKKENSKKEVISVPNSVCTK